MRCGRREWAKDRVGLEPTLSQLLHENVWVRKRASYQGLHIMKILSFLIADQFDIIFYSIAVPILDNRFFLCTELWPVQPAHRAQGNASQHHVDIF